MSRNAGWQMVKNEYALATEIHFLTELSTRPGFASITGGCTVYTIFCMAQQYDHLQNFIPHGSTTNERFVSETPSNMDKVFDFKARSSCACRTTACLFKGRSPQRYTIPWAGWNDWWRVSETIFHMLTYSVDIFQTIRPNFRLAQTASLSRARELDIDATQEN